MFLDLVLFWAALLVALAVCSLTDRTPIEKHECQVPKTNMTGWEWQRVGNDQWVRVK